MPFIVISVHEKQRVSDLLCCALEGGSNYWYYIERQTPPTTTDFRTMPERVIPHLDYPLNNGGSLTIVDKEDMDSQAKRYTLDLAAIQRGLDIMRSRYKKHYADFLAENEDATTGDVFLQCCLFGEVIYG